ncbi:endonuclease/exonuclease/phosphatase family protein [Streptomyces sp. NPDC048255]|uniref:endonuclease/exonuclease/phosphatase family protein n=1 Tax=Streptomyces sp. NPDC048255 TaxID=3154713 RepID=UPI0033D0D7C2
MPGDGEAGAAGPAGRGAGVAGPGRPARPAPPSRGRLLALLSVLAAFLLVCHRIVPDVPGHLGSLLETFLPWLGLTVPVLLGLALLRRSRVALISVLLPTAAWLGLFGGLLLPGHAPAGGFTAVQHNVSDENPDPAGTARVLIEASADLVALEELTLAALPVYEAALAAHYPHHAVQGTVGLWSKHPLSGVRPVDIRPEGIEEGWDRGLRATARTPEGDVAVYVAHLPSVRLGLSGGFRTAWRDESAVLLGRAVAAEPLEKVVLLGDLNSTVDDRGLAPVSSRMDGSGPGFAFSWPAALPVARIDQIMTRSATVTEVRALPRTGSDHLPIAARIRF